MTMLDLSRGGVPNSVWALNYIVCFRTAENRRFDMDENNERGSSWKRNRARAVVGGRQCTVLAYFQSIPWLRMETCDPCSSTNILALDSRIRLCQRGHQCMWFPRRVCLHGGQVCDLSVLRCVLVAVVAVPLQSRSALPSARGSRGERA